MLPYRERRHSDPTHHAGLPSYLLQAQRSGFSGTEHGLEERSISRHENEETVIPVFLRRPNTTFFQGGDFGHWILRPEEGELSDSINSEDEEAAELSADEGFWNQSRTIDTQILEYDQADTSLTSLARGVLSSMATTAMGRLSALAPTRAELVFDDEDIVMVYDDEEDRDQEQEVPQFDFAVPFGPRRQESYRFEIDHPTVAPVIRYLNSNTAARRLAVVGRGIQHHSVTGFNTLSVAYGRLAGTYGTTVQNIQPAFRIGRQVVREAVVLRHAAQEQWREWYPWIDRMVEATMTTPMSSRRGGF